MELAERKFRTGIEILLQSTSYWFEDTSMSTTSTVRSEPSIVGRAGVSPPAPAW
jgi:hypothetical protein